VQVVNEIRQFIDLAQQQYADAFSASDDSGMFETSYSLTRVYSLLGNLSLAGRWAHESEKHTQDPAKILAINMVLLCGLIKQKYLNHQRG